MGLRANFVTHFDLPLVLAVLAIAIAAKFTGGLSRRLFWREKTLLSMRHWLRLDASRRHGNYPGISRPGVLLINETVFVALVSIALVTSVLSGPFIKWAMTHSDSGHGV
jgi:hypothetical protein